MPTVGYACRKPGCNQLFGMNIPKVCPKCGTPSHGDYSCGKFPEKGKVEPIPVYVKPAKKKAQTPENNISKLLESASPQQRAVIEDAIRRLLSQ